MRILITGASGLLGSNLASDYAEQHDVYGVFNQTKVHLDGVRMVGADLSQPGIAEKVLEKVKPDWVVHCAAATDVDRCQADAAWANRLNRDMAEEVAIAARNAAAPLVHISTDAVYSGTRPLNRELDPPHPANVYGESKLAGESAVLEADPSALVVRTNLFGLSRAGTTSGLAAWFLGRLAGGEDTPGFADIHFSPILVSDLGELLIRLRQLGATGILNVGGSSCMTKHAFGQAVASAFGYAESLIRPSTVDQANLSAPRPKQLCLDSSRAEGLLGQRMPTVSEGLRRLVEAAPDWSRRDAEPAT